MEIRLEIKELYEKVKKHRRFLHRIPEIQLNTNKTKVYIKEQLLNMHVDEIREDFVENGIVAVFYGNDKKHMVAFRADMDALPIEEKSGVTFISEHPNKMHACGHDGHMAALLGLGELLSIHRHNLKHSIVLIFQPGEENPGGASIMIENGLFDEYPIDMIFGTHLMPDLEVGKVSCKANALMARVSELYFDIEGVGAHGAMPYLGKDALLAACTFVTQLQNIVSRSLDPTHGSVLTIGKLNAGEVRNALAVSAHLEGTMRSFDDNDHELMKHKIYEIANGIKTSFGVKVDVKIVDCYPIVMNDESLYSILKEVIGDYFIEENPRMLAEDFSFYQQKIPGLFFFTGVMDENHNCSLHDPKFNFDEYALLNTIETYIRLLEAMNILK